MGNTFFLTDIFFPPGVGYYFHLRSPLGNICYFACPTPKPLRFIPSDPVVHNFLTRISSPSLPLIPFLLF